MAPMTNDDMRREAMAENDPELLCTVDRIRFAEYLMREDHPSPLGPDALFWGKLADLLNRAAGIPDGTADTPGTWSQFNNAGDLATGYIRMAKPPAETTSRLLARDFAPSFRDVAYAVQASEDGTWPGHLGEVERFGTDRTVMRTEDYARWVLDRYLADVASDAGAQPGTAEGGPCTALRALVWLGELPGPLAEAATAEHRLPWQQAGAGGGRP
jgi:hypothetical protein